MLRFTLIGLVLAAYPALNSAAQGPPNPWLAAVVGSVQSPALELPGAKKTISVSAVRGLGDVSVLINSPQVRAERTFRSRRSDESSYEYIKAAVREAILAKIHLKIPQGVYAINAPEGSSSRAHIQLNAAEDVLLDFQGSSLIFHDLNKVGFLLIDARRVAIQNATMWWSGLSHVMGKIETSPTGLRIKIDPDYLPHVEQNQLLQTRVHAVLPASVKLPHLWDLANYNYEYHSPSEESEFVFSSEAGSYIPKRSDILEPFHVGQTVLVQNKKFGSNAFHVKGGSDLTIQGCSIGHTPGMGLFSAFFERGLAWIDNSIAPISHPLHMTTTADGVHLRNIGGDFLIQNSTFSRTSDDPINVYAGLLEVAKVESDTSFLLRSSLSSSDFKTLARDRQLSVVDNHVTPRGRAAIVAVNPISNTLARVVTSRPLVSVKSGHSAFVNNFLPRRGAIVRNTISGTRARAGIVSQGVSVSIVGNRISNTTGPAAIVGGFQNWYKEGPIAANTRVRDNSISRVGLAPFFQRFNLRGAISIGTGTTEISEVLDTKNFRAHWGIAVVRNTIQSSVTPGIQVHDTHTAWIRENTIVGSSLNERLVSVPISVNNSCNVQVRENLVDGEAGMSDESCP